MKTSNDLCLGQFGYPSTYDSNFSDMLKRHYKISSIVFSTLFIMETKPTRSTYRKRLFTLTVPHQATPPESPGRRVQEYLIPAEKMHVLTQEERQG